MNRVALIVIGFVLITFLVVFEYTLLHPKYRTVPSLRQHLKKHQSEEILR